MISTPYTLDFVFFFMFCAEKQLRPRVGHLVISRILLFRYSTISLFRHSVFHSLYITPADAVCYCGNGVQLLRHDITSRVWFHMGSAMQFVQNHGLGDSRDIRELCSGIWQQL